MKKYITLFFGFVFIQAFSQSAEITPEGALFDGKQATITAPNTDYMNFPAFTAEAFVKVNDFKSAKSGANKNYQFILFKKSTQDSHNEGFALYLDESGRRIVASVASKDKRQVCAFTDRNFIETGKWYHLAVTADESIIKLFVNGELVSSAQTNFKLDFDIKPVYIGGRESAERDFPVFDGKFNGYIDEVKIWSETKSADEIKRNIFLNPDMSDSRLCAYFPFENTENLTGIRCIPLENNSKSGDMRVFPNPASKNITLEANIAQTGYYSVDLFNLTGIRMTNLFSGRLEQTESSIMLQLPNDLPAGAYLIKLAGEAGIRTAILNKVD